MNLQTLSDYVSKVLDTNNDGQVNFRDLLDLFPNSAIAIAVLFVDLVVAVAEYRVFDVGMHMTDNNVYKALGFVLVSAVPFYLGQLFWLYPVANGLQKWIAVAMVAASLYTSWMFGTADLSRSYDVSAIVSMVVNMTAGYIVIVLGYILFDDGIKAHRLKKQAEGRATREREYQKIARSVLRELAETQKLQQETAREFGDPDLVQQQLDRLRGTKQQKPQAQPFQHQYAAETMSDNHKDGVKDFQNRQS
jgi:hypothetical protein